MRRKRKFRTVGLQWESHDSSVTVLAYRYPQLRPPLMPCRARHHNWVASDRQQQSRPKLNRWWRNQNIGSVLQAASHHDILDDRCDIHTDLLCRLWGFVNLVLPAASLAAEQVCQPPCCSRRSVPLPTPPASSTLSLCRLSRHVDWAHAPSCDYVCHGVHLAVII